LQKPLIALYPSSRMEKAVAEFGPQGTNYKNYPLDNPAMQTHTILADMQKLMDAI
jgi:hypothetical protein